MSIRPIDLDTARELLDFSGGDQDLINLGEQQLKGTVALHNMIAHPEIGVGYLADEVGMGKTYMALGVVALMRYFNPALRVLYICPSRNVQEKWYSREYLNFCKHNVKVSHFRIRGPDGKPAAPAISCRSVTELIHHATTGFHADFFVRMSAFSIALSKDDEKAWKAKLEELHELWPAFKVPKTRVTSRSVKNRYALALNEVLPEFDLVVIDEAHNFKHDLESSDRNRVLSTALGFRKAENCVSRVKNALLLSATPYDRVINQLCNQLKLVGKGDLLPEDITQKDRDRLEQCLSKFMVRRLNVLDIAGEPHTRNMYRKEWRSGEKAEINLDSDLQKLVTALVQKKVGETLAKDGGLPSFQTGLLASFESYAETTKSDDPVEFDGDIADKGGVHDARDKNVIGAISDSFIQADLGRRTLPHPKMDSVSEQLAKELFQRGRKQLVFVRRVKSVKEIKRKLDDLYNSDLAEYIRSELKSFPEELSLLEEVVENYWRISHSQDEDISGGEFIADYFEEGTDEVDDKQPPKKDTLFAWFFRGELPPELSQLFKNKRGGFAEPNSMRKGLVAKNQSSSLLMEINWVNLLVQCQGEDIDQLLNDYGDKVADIARDFISASDKSNWFVEFNACQYAFVHWYSEYKQLPKLETLANYLKPKSASDKKNSYSAQRCGALLQTYTFYCALHKSNLLDSLFPHLKSILTDLLNNGKEISEEQLQKLSIHGALLSLCLRTGHGLIDLYLARIRQGADKPTAESGGAWMDDLVSVLNRQSTQNDFNTYWECLKLSENLDLIIKTNFPEIYDKSPQEYRLFLARALSPLVPIMGATGDTASTRSAQARKFRMPGYPLALISTDVFQEGEDLHTFCDSVMHYGLSGTPVSIEQKIGRVDRVGSQAERRLLKIKTGAASTDDLIQVYFPHVKESIEVFQVRQLCHNINDFLKSLNSVGSMASANQDRVNPDEEIINRSAVPDQIDSLLKSPFEPKVLKSEPQFNQIECIRAAEQRTQSVTRNIDQRLKEILDEEEVLDAEDIELVRDDGTKIPVRISLKSARASGEILLHVLWKGETVSLREMNRAELNEHMQSARRRIYRTHASEIGNGEIQLGYDSELLVGDETATSFDEIKTFLNRFERTEYFEHYLKPTSELIRQYWEKAQTDGQKEFDQGLVLMEGLETDGALELTFLFGSQNYVRTHQVRIYELDGRCVFFAEAASAERVNDLTCQQIIKLTWLYNRNVDLAEFMLDDKGTLVGRVVHPVRGLDYKEFAYCAYTLAVATDRLEYLIDNRDRY